MSFFRFAVFTALSMSTLQTLQAQSGKLLYDAARYQVYEDRVTQGAFTARAVSATQMQSDYQSPRNENVSSKLEFKFSINRKDNEMKAGANHWFNYDGKSGQTPLITFGTPLKMTDDEEYQIKPESPLKIRLDLRPVLAEIKSKGYFTTFKGDKIYKEDFKHVYVAGATEPMTWDFDNLHQRPQLELKDPDGNGIYETTVILNAKQDQKQTDGVWNMTRNTAAFPQYQSPQLLPNALYNLALEEMINAVEPDSTFRTGKEWAGVWTRDISYSIILSMAYLQPKVAMNSLMRKVNAQNRIIQDTGTGGAWPCSTDRMIWATAAWEVYKATGDKKWLEQSFTIVKNSVADDVPVAYDAKTGLVRGESSFLDWREQTYPKWMQPADIYQSETLGTNAAHFQANTVLAHMAEILGKPDVAKKHRDLAQTIKNGINQYLWLPEKGYYAQYLYGRHHMSVSPRAETLGEALCILFGIADEKRAEQIIASMPQTAFGATCIYPQIPGLPPYHNDAVWPFVQSYWAMASAKAKNTASVEASLAAVYRPAALFLTNKENFVAGNGDFAGTVINSSNMLWSLSGSLALVHKILFGIEFQADRLTFHPLVPKTYAGTRTLSNFKFRDALLDITVEGFGNGISKFTIDGKTSAPEILATLKGKHSILIVLNGTEPQTKINLQPNVFTPDTPQVSLSENQMQWPAVSGAVVYQILRNGKIAEQTKELKFKPATGEYQIVAVAASGLTSFASEPVVVGGDPLVFEAEASGELSKLGYKGFTGKGFVETSKTVNPSVTLKINVPEKGTYALDIRYANGNGPTNTENKCAIRSLSENGKFLGTLVFPQRGVQEWSNWGFSNVLLLDLDAGAHELKLSLETQNENMNGTVNQAMLDYVRLTKI